MSHRAYVADIPTVPLEYHNGLIARKYGTVAEFGPKGFASLRSDTVQFLMKFEDKGTDRYCTPSKKRISVRLFSQIHPARIRMCLQSDGMRDSDWTMFYLGIALPAALGLAVVAGFFKFLLRSPEIVNIECSRVELCPIKTTCIMISITLLLSAADV